MKNEIEALAVSPRLYKELKDLRYINEEQDKEIEGLKEEKESWKRVATKNFNEAEDYKAIIKEVREWSKKLKYETIQQTTREELLEILDKENKE